MNEQYERLKTLAEQRFGNLSKLGKKIGKDASFFYVYKNRKGFSQELLEELKNNFGINPIYIQYGEGEPFISNSLYNESPAGIPNVGEPVPVTGFISVKDINRIAYESMVRKEEDLLNEITGLENRIEELKKQLREAQISKTAYKELLDNSAGNSARED